MPRSDVTLLPIAGEPRQMAELQRVLEAAPGYLERVGTAAGPAT